MRIPIPAVLVPAVFFLLYFFLPGLREQPWTPLRVFGAVLGWTAYALVLTARLQLGKSFSHRAKATALVTHGLYSRIRNPLYIFVELMIFGLLLALNLRWVLLVLPVIIVMHARQARREAKILEERFGDEYRNYRKSTWF